MSIDSQEFIDALEDAGQEPRSYSGRGMYGDSCVGVTLDSDSELWELAQALAHADMDVPGPRTDSMGRSSIIAYWPSIKWPEDA